MLCSPLPGTSAPLVGHKLGNLSEKLTGGVDGRGGLPPRQSSLVLLGIRRSWGDAWTQEMGVLPLPGLNLNRNQTGQSGPYCKLRPTRVLYFDFRNSRALGKGLVYASSFILLVRICVYASSCTLLARIHVCLHVLIEGIQLMVLACGSRNLSMKHFVTGWIHGWIHRGS